MNLLDLQYLFKESCLGDRQVVKHAAKEGLVMAAC